MAFLALNEFGRLLLKFLLLFLRDGWKINASVENEILRLTHLGAADMLLAEMLQRANELILGSFQLEEK